ncbi:MAG: 6-phospho-beta-glucosidase [Culicoidibacterales bacterium]
MKKTIKIVTIGGGSSYTPELIEGFIKRAHELPIREIWLVDIEAGKEKLEIVGELARRMVKKAGLDWQVHLTLNRREALVDADYVTTQLRVGLLDARVKDERIPLEHGMLGQETNGAGGAFKAFRTIPVILDIVRDMKELCPNAWLINFTNPAGIVTEAVLKYGDFKRVVGLCNVPVNQMMSESKELGVDVNDLTFQFAGLNHLVWHKVWDKQGNEITTDVMQRWLESNDQGVANIENIPWIDEQVLNLGLIPCFYHRYFYLEEEMLQKGLKDFANNGTRAEVVQQVEHELFELYRNPNLEEKPKQLELRGGAYYSDAACELITSIQNDKRTLMVVDTQNNGTIADLPYDCAIETTAMITASGPKPVNFGHFPASARGLVQVMKAFEELVVDAAVTGDYGTALQALTMNPLVKGASQAKAVLDEMLVAHAEHLPQFQAYIEAHLQTPTQK